jgi:enoyl-CoA hydratase/carnithine racemase
MSENLVNLSIEDVIASVTLDRPDKHNALNISMFQAIYKTIKTNRHVRVVIVSGAGEKFCSGLT